MQMKAVEAVPLYMMAGLFVLIDSSALLAASPIEISSSATATVALGNPNDRWNLAYYPGALDFIC